MVQLIASKDHHQYGEAKRAAARQTRGEPADSDTESFSFFQVLLISSSSSSSFLLAAFQNFGVREKKRQASPSESIIPLKPFGGRMLPSPVPTPTPLCTGLV
jgi:hypothetical protein